MYVLMGSNGNVTSKAARALLAQGQKVRVIGRDQGKLATLAAAGAELALGNALDASFLASTFRAATGVYTMIPPDYTVPDLRVHQGALSEAIVAAIRDAGVRRVVNLSSAGASLQDGTGPIAGLHDHERRLDRLPGVDVLHLRAAYFMENHLNAAGLVRATGVYPGMIAAGAPLAMVATRDVADAVARELVSPSSRGHAVRHLLGPRSLTMTEAARILGVAIGKPDLRYVEADHAQVKAGLVQHGFSRDVAERFEEMCRALSDGRIEATFTRDAASSTPTTLETFAREFAARYAATETPGGGH